MSAHFERARQKYDRIVLTHNNDFDGGRGLVKLTSDLESTDAGHADIEQDEIREKSGRALDGLVAIFGFAADLPWSARQNRFHATPNMLVVIGDQDSHGKREAVPA